MDRTRDVKPITYLKNRTADLVREVRDSGRTVTITQNGEARVVLMDVDTYDRWRSAMALLKVLALAEADLEAGRTVPQAEALRRADAVLKRARRDA
jgi:prevent-host-death family protein